MKTNLVKNLKDRPFNLQNKFSEEGNWEKEKEKGKKKEEKEKEKIIFVFWRSK